MTDITSFTMVAKEIGSLNENEKLYRTFDNPGLRDRLGKVEPMVDNSINVIARQAGYAKAINAIDLVLNTFSVPSDLFNLTEMKKLYDACNGYHGVRRSKAEMITLKNILGRATTKRDSAEKKYQAMTPAEQATAAFELAAIDLASDEFNLAFMNYTEVINHETKYLQFKDALKQSLDLTNLMIETFRRVFPGTHNEMHNINPPTTFVGKIDHPAPGFNMAAPAGINDYAIGAGILMGVVSANTEVFHRPFSDWLKLADCKKILVSRYASVDKSELVKFRNSLYDGSSYKMEEDYKLSEWVHCILIPAFEALQVSSVVEVRLTDGDKMQIFQINTSSIERFKPLNQKWSSWLNGNLLEPRPNVFSFGTQIAHHETVDNWHWTTSKLQPKILDVVEANSISYGRDGIKKKITAFQGGRPSHGDAKEVICYHCKKTGHFQNNCPEQKQKVSERNSEKSGKRKEFNRKPKTEKFKKDKKREPSSGSASSQQAGKKLKSFSSNQIEFHCNELISTEEASQVVNLMGKQAPPAHWIADSGTQAFITPSTDKMTNLVPSERMFVGVSGQCSAVDQTGDYFNLSNVAVSSQARRALCSTLLLAKDSNMVSVVTDGGTLILKPGSKIGINRSDVLVTALEVDGLHRLTDKQMEIIAKTAPKK